MKMKNDDVRKLHVIFLSYNFYYMENYSGNVKTAEVRWVLMCFPETKRVSLEIPKLDNIESISNYAGYFLAMAFTGHSLK